MNGCGKCSLCPWSEGQDDEASVLSESVDESKMPYHHKKREDGSYEKNAILKKIYKDFGSLSMSYKNPYGMTYSKSSVHREWKRAKAGTPPPNSAKYEPYKPNGTPRYSKIDKFIENLNQACAALPKPLIEDFGRVRPHTVEVQSQSKKEVRMIKVRGTEPILTQINACDDRDGEAVSKEDSEHSQSPIVSGHIAVPRVAELNIRASPEMGPWKNGDEARDCERQARKSCSDDNAFESKKMELVRAATMLQSRYRGYRVRRSQPLKYMHLMGNAKSKLEELKQQFNAWKLAVWFPTAYSERQAMTENVMNLLMELDSIQGVPLYIRDFRKSVARDVIKFQEEVDAFLRHKTKHGALFDLVGNDNTRRPKSRTEGRTGHGNAIENASRNEAPNGWNTVVLSSNQRREFGPVEEVTGALNSNELNSAARGEREECEADNIVQRNQLEPENVDPMCPEEVIQSEEESLLCPQPSVEPQDGAFLYHQSTVDLAVGADNELSHDQTHQPESIGAQTCDIYIPLREDSSSRTSRKKKYGVRFEDDVNLKEIYSGIQPLLVTEQSRESPNENSSSHDVAIVKFDDRSYVASSCSDESARRELTDSHEQRDEVYSSAVPVAQKFVCLKNDAGDEVGSRKGKGQPACANTLLVQGLATQQTNLTILVHCSESLAEENSRHTEVLRCLSPSGDVNVRGRLKYLTVMADTKNASECRFGSLGAVTMSSKSRFHKEQSHLRTSPDDSIRTSHNHVNYEGSCNSSDGSTSETSEAREGMEEHERKREDFHSEAIRMKLPALGLEQKKMVTFACDDTEIGADLKSSRLLRTCGKFQSIRKNAKNALDERISDGGADTEIESDVEIDGVPEVENVSCCSDCARPGAHYPLDCWKPRVSTGEEEGLTHSCKEDPGEVQEEYVPVSYKDAGGPANYFRPPERAEFCGFDHRELRYVTDPDTLKLRRLRRAAQGRTAKNDRLYFESENCRLLSRAPTAVQHVPKTYAHKTTSYTSSPPESVCSEAERSYQRCRSHAPYREIVASKDRRVWETDEREIPDQELVTKLVDDNKRLKGLLKDVMNWNKAQATAMVSMSERIEHLEDKHVVRQKPIKSGRNGLCQLASSPRTRQNISSRTTTS